MTEKVQPTERLKFEWAQVSPDPHNVTMRNTLEPVETFIEIEVPLKGEYFANIERLIKISLGTDDLSRIEPILTVEGMKFVIETLSLANSEFEPVEEEFDDNWEDDTVSKDDTTSKDELNEDDFEDDDFNWEDE